MKLKLVESACSLGKQSLVSKPHATAVPTQRTESPGGALPRVRLPAFVTSSVFINPDIDASKHLPKTLGAAQRGCACCSLLLPVHGFMQRACKVL